MRLVYKPEGQEEPQRWTVALGKFRSLEVEHIEKLTGWDYGSDYQMRLLKGNMLARRALLFTLLRREHPHLKFTDVDFAADEAELEFDVAELRDFRKAAESSKAVSELEREAVLEELDRQIAEELERDGEGKVPTPTSEGATG